MGVYIPNIEMPKSCAKCPLNSAPPNGCLIWTINDIRKDKRNESCPLVEIPTPHGRLIDGDELCNEFSNRCPGDCGCCGESRDDIYDCGLIINAPTILEAEE